MGLGTWLLENAIDSATGNKKSVRKTMKKLDEQEKQIAQAKSDLIEQERRITQEKWNLAEQKRMMTQYNPVHSEYDIRLVCAKIAICGYIINADNQISEAEFEVLNSLLDSVNIEYGQAVHARAVQAYKNSTIGFLNVQDYLRKVHVKDIKNYLQAADEIAEIDGTNDAERKAIQRIKDYIEQQETGSAQSLVCPSCSGVMNIDDYGYKATCTCCGREVIIDSSNAPASAYREINKPIEKAAPEKKNVEETKPVSEKPAPAKSKKGKIAMKVALGVMTGGVSLIPDAVSAAKKNKKK